MSFLHPEFLYYMLPPLFILFALLLTQKESQATFFSEEVMQKLRVSANTLTLKARNGLFMLIGVLLVVALAGPIIEEGKVEVKAKSADIMIALDISDSMLAEDVYPNRLKLAKQKALELLRVAPNERIGVIGFARNSYLVSPLSFDHEAVSFLLRQLSTDSITEQGTNILSMLEVVDKSIKNDSKKYLLILSDGGDNSDFSREIALAKEKNITVFILGIGTPKGAPIKANNGEFIKQNGAIIVSKLNSDIAKLATKTGGVFIESVNSDKDIKRMLQEIESHSEKKELKSQEIARFIPLFYFPLGLALFLLLIATSSMSKRKTVQVPLALFATLMLFQTPNLHAGLFDFSKLDEAKKAYEAKDYEKSAKIYGEYGATSTKGESYYNAANALYKQGKYKEAIASYEKATFDDKASRAKNFSNMGNAYVKLSNEESLKKAIEAYTESLKLQEDKDTQENLEAVKKALEKKKEQQQQNQKNDNKDNKQDKKEQNQQDKQEQNKENSDENKEQNQENQQNSQDDKKDMKSKEQSKDEEAEQEQKEKEQKEKQENQDKKEEQNQSQDMNQTQEQKQEKSHEDKLEELGKDGNSSSQTQQQMTPAQMSDAEESKWIGQLNKQQNTYLYMLNKNNKVEENTNEKPW